MRAVTSLAAVLAAMSLGAHGQGKATESADVFACAYGALVAGGQADVFLTYCTNGVLARKEEPSLAVISLPESLAVGADYGLTTMNGASAGGKAFAEFLLSAEGRRVLESQGFSPPS